ncbi:hypothetical protein [Limihaloglobus sulfuriphilus]|nr:hypothetical protein [Limihaloglobus sulfuriphilus]
MNKLMERIKAILVELRHHSPFTLFGAFLGLVFMLLFKDLSTAALHSLFMVFHPGHVLLSAFVTTSLYKINNPKTGIIKLCIIGYVGSIGIATLSDCVLPYFGERIMGISVPVHAALHSEHSDDTDIANADETMHEHGEEMTQDHAGEDTAEHVHTDECEHQHNHHHDGFIYEKLGLPADLHLAFIDDWEIVTPAALLGIFMAMFFPATKFPHAIHVLISTWASSCHIMLNLTQDLTIYTMAGILVVLFIAVWVPCCLSDIVFPVAFSHGGCSYCREKHKKNGGTDKAAEESS